MNNLTPLDMRLLNEFQHHFPLVSQPYQEMAERLGISEEELLSRLQSLQNRGIISRVGAVLRTGQVGVSTLAAMQIPAADLERIASLVNSFPEVNHNYERDHAINLWFVLTAESPQRLQSVIDRIETESGFSVYVMPMIKPFHIDLGFPLH
ncbi:Lrp/AsnC family transcriptional regulator [Candidatus Magnetaquicoccus inordinatus]|uniref:Lrp/AsnC family transcriptional regulator n=1 Tax=Candidatus Magnetaquicoccus inordinatus TaxID=2496818 RepID=UPI00102B7A22|nr:Lrp/AsnC family transcriptional regulator [Candidatus Magnetaquicoccus inordinatus]